MKPKTVEEIVLSDAQQSAVIALAIQKQQIIVSANEQIDKITAAMVEQARLVALVNGLPADGWEFEQRDEKIWLVKKQDDKGQT